MPLRAWFCVAGSPVRRGCDVHRLPQVDAEAADLPVDRWRRRKDSP